MPRFHRQIALIAAFTTSMLIAADPDPKRDLSEMVATRDALAKEYQSRLESDDSRCDLLLEFQEVRPRKSATAALVVRRGVVMGSTMQTPYNRGVPIVHASTLRWDGTTLSGTMGVTLMPDQWYPADHLPRQQVFRIKASTHNGVVSGKYWLTGEMGPESDAIIGSQRRPDGSAKIFVTRSVDDTKDIASQAWEVYKDCRALVRCKTQAWISFEDARKEQGVPSVHWKNTTAEQVTYVARLANLVRRIQGGEPPQYLQQNAGAPSDPAFGTFYGATPLEQTDVLSPVQLPEETGQDGLQRWQYIPKWELTGPFPTTIGRDDLVPTLPSWIPTSEAQYPVATADLDPTFFVKEWDGFSEFCSSYRVTAATRGIRDNTPPWNAKPPTYFSKTNVSLSQEGRWGYSIVPGQWQVISWLKLPSYGVINSVWYARAFIDAPRDLQTYVEVAASNAGQLWIDDALVLTCAPDYDHVSGFLVPISLTKGKHEIVLRVRHDWGGSKGRVLFCTRGKPNPVKQAVTEQNPNTSSLHYGFRGNGTGSFPAPKDGQPVAAFDLAKGTNVAWRKDLPPTHSYPIVVGDRVLTNADPHTLYCFDKMTGKELWKTDCSIADLLQDEASKKAVNDYITQISNNTTKTASKETTERMLAIQKLRENEAKPLTPEEDKKLQDEFNALRDSLSVSTQQNSIVATVRKQFPFGDKGGWSQWWGGTMPTPVSDGNKVWIRYGGVVACIDLSSGKRDWIVHTGMTHGVPTVSSPLLIAGRIIVEGNPLGNQDDIRKELNDTMKADLHTMICLDAATGKECWRINLLAGNNGYGSPGGPQGAILPGIPGGLPVAISYSTMVRISDGKILSRGIQGRVAYGDWIIGNTVNGHARYRAITPDMIGEELLTETGLSGVLSESGYAHKTEEIKTIQGAIAQFRHVVQDAKTGRQIFQQGPVLEITGMNYVPPAACGPYAYLVGGGCGEWANLNKGLGMPVSEIVTVKASPPFSVIARSSLDSVTFTGPIFDGERMYLRTEKSLLCFARTPAGEKLEHEAMFKEMFASSMRFQDPPEPKTLLVLDPPADLLVSEETPVNKLYEMLGPKNWLITGPFPSDGSDHLSASGGLAKTRFSKGMKIGALECATLDPNVIKHVHGMYEGLGHNMFFNDSVSININGFAKGQPGIWYLFTVVEATKDRVMKYRLDGNGVESWISGKKIDAEIPLLLKQGLHPLTIRLTMSKLPPAIAKREISISPQFYDELDPRRAFGEWKKKIMERKDDLNRLLTALPDSPFVIDAKRYLARLEE